MKEIKSVQYKLLITYKDKDKTKYIRRYSNFLEYLYVTTAATIIRQNIKQNPI